MNFKLRLHTDAEADLEGIWQCNSSHAAAITVLLDEIRNDQSLLDDLSVHGFGPAPNKPFNVSKFFELWRLGYGIWRLKIWDLSNHPIPYRIVYTLDPKTSTYYILGILHRDFNYEPEDDRTKRILEAFNELGCRTY